MSTATATVPAKLVNPRRLREYETIYILQSNVDADEADRIAARMKEIISARSGHLVKIDNWGKRKLAYPINKASRGVFVFMKYLGYEDVVAEIERNLRLLDPVVRYQTVLMNGDVKREAYTIDEADLEFRRLEVSAEPDEEPGVAQRLGLVDLPRQHRPDHGYGEEGGEDEYGGPPLDDSGYGNEAADDEEEAS